VQNGFTRGYFLSAEKSVITIRRYKAQCNGKALFSFWFPQGANGKTGELAGKFARGGMLNASDERRIGRLTIDDDVMAWNGINESRHEIAPVVVLFSGHVGKRGYDTSSYSLIDFAIVVCFQL
jgi:hypothetical protein